MHIALFENDPDYRFLLEKVLKRAGHIVSSFENAFGFILKVPEGKFDAVITGNELNGGPSGIDVCQYVSDYWSIPVPCLLHTNIIRREWPKTFAYGSFGELVTIAEKEPDFAQIKRFLESLSKQ